MRLIGVKLFRGALLQGRWDSRPLLWRCGRGENLGVGELLAVLQSPVKSMTAADARSGLAPIKSTVPRCCWAPALMWQDWD